MNKGICNLIMFILFAIGCIVFFGCEKKKVKVYSTDPPKEQGFYLTWVDIKYIDSVNTWDSRWEVLYFHPDITAFRTKWNTMHLDGDDRETKVVFWTNLPKNPCQFSTLQDAINSDGPCNDKIVLDPDLDNTNK